MNIFSIWYCMMNLMKLNDIVGVDIFFTKLGQT
jgi:hypothetical protein